MTTTATPSSKGLFHAMANLHLFSTLRGKSTMKLNNSDSNTNHNIINNSNNNNNNYNNNNYNNNNNNNNNNNIQTGKAKRSSSMNSIAGKQRFHHADEPLLGQTMSSSGGSASTTMSETSNDRGSGAESGSTTRDNNTTASSSNSASHVNHAITKPAVAPSATVGAWAPRVANSADDTSTVISSADYVSGKEVDIPSRGGRSLAEVDVDVQMGYPSAMVIEYWREKDMKRFRRWRFDVDADYVPHRRYMVDWICEVGEELHMQAVTIHVAIAYLDELMHIVGYSHSQWRLRAVCCLSVAAKYEEAECNMPMVSELADASELRLTTGIITRGELEIAQRLSWDLSRASSMHFLGYYLYRGVTFESDTCQGRPLVDKVVRYTKKYVEFFANLCQQDYAFQMYPCATIAGASIMSARRALNILPIWREGLVKLTGMKEHEVKKCGDELWAFYEKMFPTHKPLRTDSSQTTRSPSAGGAEA